jgi:hypothetical protein
MMAVKSPRLKTPFDQAPVLAAVDNPMLSKTPWV